MNQQTFDIVTRTAANLSRRDTMFRLASLGLGVGMLWRPAISGARKKRQRKKRTPRARPNAFGCLNVGQPCRGDSSQCCSGICEGTAPKKGKKDRSRCVGHNAAICTGPESDTCSTGVAHYCNGANLSCGCLLTTGNGGFCGGLVNECRGCRRDADCQEEFGSGAACVIAAGICEGRCPETGGTLCVSPCPEA